MPSVVLKISNQLGIHIRAASKLVHCAQRFSSRMTLIKAGKRADAKSILNVVTLGAVRGDDIILEVEGEDAEAALAAVSALINAKFHEE